MVGYAGSISAGRNRDISVAKQAEYLAGWMNALGLERAILAGHDLGGGVAQIAAVGHRDRYAGLFLTNAIAYDPWPIPSVKAMRATRGAVMRLTKLGDGGIFFHGVSLHLAVLAGFSTCHDTPPSQLTSPKFGHSSAAVATRRMAVQPGGN